MIPNDDLPPFSKGEYDRRFRMLREAMSQKGLDCLLVYGACSWTGNDPGFVHAVYLSNVVTPIQNYVVFPLKGDPTVVTQSHGGFTKLMSSIEDTRVSGLLQVGLVKRIKELGLQKGRIGIVGPNATIGGDISIPWEHRDYLNRELPDAKLGVVTKWYAVQILQKSDEEIAYLERAGKATDEACERLVAALRPGIRHCDLRDIIYEVANLYHMQVPGLNMQSFPMSVSSPLDAEWLQGYEVIDAGHVVVMTPMISIGGYMGKAHFTAYVGEPNQLYRKMHEVAGQVNQQLIKELKPGMTGADVAKFLEPLTEAGVTTFGPTVVGWGNYPSYPRCGEIGSVMMESEWDRKFVFKPGLSVALGPNVQPVAAKAAHERILTGGSALFTKDGMRRLVNFPTWEPLVGGGKVVSYSPVNCDWDCESSLRPLKQ